MRLLKYVKKDDIITTALRLFNSYSYNSIGVDRIISESGVAKMTFYKYFPSKEKLIEECLLLRNSLLQNSLTAAISKEDEINPLARIKAIFYGIQIGLIVKTLMVACSKSFRRSIKTIPFNTSTSNFIQNLVNTINARSSYSI